MKQTVAIIGASEKPDRYAYMAAHLLEEHGHRVIPVNPSKTSIEGRPCIPDLGASESPVDTVTVYVQSTRFMDHLPSVIQARPARVIFNPGAECPEAYPELEKHGIEVLEACTLVLLRTQQFE